MSKMTFTIYDGDCMVTIDITQEKKNEVFDRLLNWYLEHNCLCGETLCQSDNCNIDAPIILADIVDNVMDFKTEWIDE